MYNSYIFSIEIPVYEEKLINTTTLGYFLRMRREQSGYSLRGFEKVCGVSSSQIARIERDELILKDYQFNPLCKALNIKMTDLERRFNIRKID